MILNKIFETRLNPESINEANSKNYAQYFTSVNIAEYMAKMVEYPIIKNSLHQTRILDACAGEGILGIAAVLHCVAIGCKNIHLTAYEIDENLIEYGKQQFKI